jgi:flagellar FliL protein
MAEDPAKEGSKENLKFFKHANGESQKPADQIKAEELSERESEEKAAGAPKTSGADNIEAEPAQSDAEHKAKGELSSVHLLPLLTPTLALAIRTLVILAIIVADASAAYFLVVKALAPRLTEIRVVRELAPPEVPEEVEEPEKTGAEARNEPTVGTITPIADIVINPSGTGGKRYLCTTVALEAVDPRVVEEVKGREPQIRDLLIEILSRRTVEDLGSLQTREDIREEIKVTVNDLLVTGEVVGVYFSNFVLQ